MWATCHYDLSAGVQRLLGNIEVNGTVWNVDHDSVSGFDKGDQAPSAASGETWPIDSPELPPEKRPSVSKAQDLARPFDLR